MSIDRFMYRPVDIAPLAVFRILMGLLMSAEGFGAILTGWVRKNYVEPEFTFNFIGFDFLQVIVGPQAYVVYALLGFAGLSIALGYRYKLSIAVYTVLWAAVYFGQKTSYNNHYYLLLLYCVLLWLVPAHRAVSLDVRSGRVAPLGSVPYWCKWSFKMLLLIVYTYAAIAKLYPDWLDGTAVRTLLGSKHDFPVIGSLVGNDIFIYVIAYGGIVFDFLVVPALWYGPTRRVAFAISIGFHLFNSIVFQIGIFPYMMLISSVLYFDQAYIRKLFLRKAPQWHAPTKENLLFIVPFRKKIFEGSLAIFFILMLLLPLRPFYYPGSPHWSEEGHRLSWHMMLRSKWGNIQFVVKDAEGELIAHINPGEELPGKMARGMATRPDLIWQYAQRLRIEYEEENGGNVQVFAVSRASLNGRPLAALIDPNTDLASVEWSHLRPSPWILKHPDL